MTDPTCDAHAIIKADTIETRYVFQAARTAKPLTLLRERCALDCEVFTSDSQLGALGWVALPKTRVMLRRGTLQAEQLMHWHISRQARDDEYAQRLSLSLRARGETVSTTALDVQQAARTSLASVDVLIALIGPGATQTSRASTMLNELRLGVSLKKPIIPVLVQGSALPSWPEDLSALARANTCELGELSFERDAQQMIDRVLKPGGSKAWRAKQVGTLIVRGNNSGFVAGYFDSEHAPVKVIVDGQQLGVMDRLVGREFRADVDAGEHELTLLAGNFPTNLSIAIHPGQTLTVLAQRHWLLGRMSIAAKES